jgi:murein DD-endopeptidase MepM/ murein hydrolase activator NlpD
MLPYTKKERAVLENAVYLTAGQYPFTVPIDALPHPNEGWKALRGNKLHQGLDFMVPIGTPVFAAGPGLVTVSRNWGTATGRWIVVEHSGPLAGFQSRYIHLSRRLAKVGDLVKSGDLIALSGDTGGRLVTPHLHFDIQADVAARPEIKTAFGRHFIGREFHGKRNVPADILLPLADADRPGYLAPGLTGPLELAANLLPPTEKWYLPPPGIPLVPTSAWIASLAFGVAIATSLYAAHQR